MKIKVLIVDDSLIFRSSIETALAGEEDIAIIGSVRNGVKAIEFIKSTRPHLVTLDVEMPEMNGLETLHAIRDINRADENLPPIGVIMVSAHTQKGADTTIAALEADAFDFITKPQTRSREESTEILRRQLLVKIRYFASKLISSTHPRYNARVSPTISRPSRPISISKIKAVLIGVSTGGPKALATILPPICEKIAAPIFIVQHMPPGFTLSLAQSLDSKCRHKAKEGRNNEPVRENHIYIAPGGSHMLLRRKGNQVNIMINEQPPENGTRPSADVLFRSAPIAYGSNTVAIILTGMGNDGTKGISTIKRAGGYIIAQDEETSVVWGMPGSAVSSGYVDVILPLNVIPDKLCTII